MTGGELHVDAKVKKALSWGRFQRLHVGVCVQGRICGVCDMHGGAIAGMRSGAKVEKLGLWTYADMHI